MPNYKLTTDTVMDYYVRNCTVGEDQAIWDFCEWLQGVKDASYREGRRDGALFGDAK